MKSTNTHPRATDRVSIASVIRSLLSPFTYFDPVDELDRPASVDEAMSETWKRVGQNMRTATGNYSNRNCRG